MSKLIDIPPETTKIWGARLKSQVVTAIRSGRLEFDEACQRYQISPEELNAWIGLMEKHGALGLRATCIQKYRQKERAAGDGSSGAS